MGGGDTDGTGRFSSELRDACWGPTWVLPTWLLDNNLLTTHPWAWLRLPSLQPHFLALVLVRRHPTPGKLRARPSSTSFPGALTWLLPSFPPHMWGWAGRRVPGGGCGLSCCRVVNPD